MYENYQTITLAATAERFHMSIPYLSTRIHKMTGHTFSEHIKRYKLQYGADLLLRTDMKLDLIVGQVGYTDTAQFIRSFKKEYGMTPIKYRKWVREKMKTLSASKSHILPRGDVAFDFGDRIHRMPKGMR